MRYPHLLLLMPLIFGLGSLRAEPVTMALVGDSTVADYPVEKTILRGWGQLLPEFLVPGTRVLNVAESGRSTSTFPKEAWQKVLEARPAFVLIQFGHNDSHAKGQPEATDASTDFRENLRRYVREAREANIKPILVTPVCRRTFRKDGTLKDSLAPYAEGMKVVAEEMKVPLVDLHARSRMAFEKLGEAGTTEFTANERERKGKKGEDRTHFTEAGARAVARLVAEALPEADPALAPAVRQP